MTPAEFAQNTNEYITEYIKFADAKAGALLAFVVVLGGVIATTTKSLVEKGYGAGPWIFVCACLAGGMLVVSLALTLWNVLATLAPRTSRSGSSLHSFPDLARLVPADAVKLVENLSEAGMAEQLVRHNVVLAQVANAKYQALGRAVFWLHFGLLSSATLAILFVVTGAD